MTTFWNALSKAFGGGAVLALVLAGLVGTGRPVEATSPLSLCPAPRFCNSDASCRFNILFTGHCGLSMQDGKTTCECF